MNRRIRKKHRLGEYTQLGFEASIPDAFDDDPSLDALIGFVEAHDMGIGGNSEGVWVTRLSGGSLSPTDAAALQAWCDARQWRCSIGPLVDVWHPGPQPKRIHPRATR